MKYSIKAHPTVYAGVHFRSRLEARWAAFFDVVGWEWDYEPVDLHGWSPDFRVTFPCRHSECSGSHTLLVEVKPYTNIKQFQGHRCMDFSYGVSERGEEIPADASAAFGESPRVSYWEMAHGAGGGEEEVDNWVVRSNCNTRQAWIAAGNMVQWHPNKKKKR